MNAKKWLKVWLLITISSIPIIGAFNYIVDPYGLNSSNNKYDKSLTGVNKPNITNLKINLKSDYYLIGTSRLIRVNPKVVETYLVDKQVYNINISGATFRENSMLAKKVIHQGSRVIYGFDAFSLNENRLMQGEILHRYKTYKDTLENDDIYEEYWSIDLFIMSIKDIFKRIIGVKQDKYTISQNTKNYKITVEGIKKHLDLENNGTIKSFSDFKMIPMDEIASLAKLAKKDDIFIIYPKHYYHYLLFHKYQNIEEEYFKAIKTLVNNTEAKVWSFYDINDITVNTNNFDKNGWHFKPKITDLIFSSIYGNDNVLRNNTFATLLNKDTVEEYLIKLSEKIKNYELNSTTDGHE